MSVTPSFYKQCHADELPARLVHAVATMWPPVHTAFEVTWLPQVYSKGDP